MSGLEVRECFNNLPANVLDRAFGKTSISPESIVTEDKIDNIASELAAFAGGDLYLRQDPLGHWLPRIKANSEEFYLAHTFSVRASNVLRTLSVKTPGDLAEISINKIWATKNCGRKTCLEILRNAIATHLAAILHPGLPYSPDPGPEAKRKPGAAPLITFDASPFRWATAVRGHTTVGDLLSRNQEILGVPREIQRKIDLLLETPITHLQPQPEEVQASLDFVLGVFNRDLSIFFLRMRKVGAAQTTLEEIGSAQGLSRERVRQLCKRVESGLEGRLSQSQGLLIRWRVDELASQLLNGVPEQNEIAQAALPEASRGLEIEGAAITDFLLHLAGEYRVQNHWLLKKGAEIPEVEKSDLFSNQPFIPESAIEKWLEEGGFRTAVLPEVVEFSRIRKLSKGWALWNGPIEKKAELVLRAAEKPEPWRVDELVDAIGENFSKKGIRQRLYNDERFKRVSKNEIALREWGFEEYSGVANEMSERIEREGGSIEINKLINELEEVFGTPETSVRLYLKAPKFFCSDGVVRLRDEADHFDLNRDFQGVKGLFPDFKNGLIHYTLLVDSDIERGSGALIREAVAVALGLGPGGQEAFSTEVAGESLSVQWRNTSTTGADLGSTRTLANEAGAVVGDEFRLTFDLGNKSVRSTRIAQSKDEDLRTLTGLNIRPGNELKALADSLECLPEQVRAILAERGDDKVLGQLPAPEQNPALEQALADLSTLLED